MRDLPRPNGVVVVSASTGVWSELMNGDFCDNDGARRLKQKIEEYWTGRGFDVSINLVDAGFATPYLVARDL